MAIDYNHLLNLAIPDSAQQYAAREAMLYALALGVGSDPVDPEQLRFVYERDLKVLPTMGVVLAHPGFWPRDLDTGLDWMKIVHGEQGLELHRPLPAAARVIGHSRVVDIIDKGPGKGALVYYERRIVDADSGELLCTVTQTMFCRGDGGCGGPTKAPPQPHLIPARAPDQLCELPTLPQAALLYRLCGDVNPLHADPAVARAAGFERPIMHGLGTFGVAGYALLKTVCDSDPTRFKAIKGRFTAPVYPGERLETSMWIDGDIVSFRVRSVERDVVAIDNGRLDLNTATGM
jgi:acyl dehydratase